MRLLFSFTPSDSVRKERRHAVLRSAEGRLDNGDFIGAALRIAGGGLDAYNQTYGAEAVRNARRGQG